MPIKVTCSNCGGILHAPDDAGGKRGRCPTCGNILPIPAIGASASLADEPTGGGRASSLGDMPIGPQVTPPASSNPLPSGPSRGSSMSFSAGGFGSDASARSSVPSLTEPPPPVKPKKPVAPLPPPVDAGPAVRTNDPFARSATKTPSGPSTPQLIKNWKRCRSGLWWIRLAALAFLVPVLALHGLAIYEAIAGPLPVKQIGYLGKRWMSSTREFELFAIAAPIAVGLLFLMFGRLGFANAPKNTMSRGLTTVSSLGTILAVAGLMALVLPVAWLIIEGNEPPFDVFGGEPQWSLFIAEDAPGMIQRLGISLGIAAFVAAELCFISALGRIATNLQDTRLAARTTRFFLLLVFVIGAWIATASFVPAYNFDKGVTRIGQEVNKTVRDQWNANAQPLYDKLDTAKPIVRSAFFLVGGLMVGLAYLRMVGAGRAAIRNWVENHEMP